MAAGVMIVLCACSGDDETTTGDSMMTTVMTMVTSSSTSSTSDPDTTTLGPTGSETGTDSDTTTAGTTTTGTTTTGSTTEETTDPTGVGDSPLLWSTLDDAFSVSNPASGSGDMSVVNTNPADDFVPAQIDGGINLDDFGELVSFRQTSMDGAIANVELDRGTAEFWYQPTYDHEDSTDHPLFSLGSGDDGWIRVRKAAGNNLNALQVLMFEDGGGLLSETGISSQDYGWSANEWHHFVIAWDTTVPPGERNAWVYIDGAEVPPGEPPFGSTGMGPLVMPEEDASRTIDIGGFPGQGLLRADGIFDEFRLYDEVLAP